MAAYLWQKNEKELLKKLTLAEAYTEVALGKELGVLDAESSLYQALQSTFGGSSGDYLSDRSIKISPNEERQF